MAYLDGINDFLENGVTPIESIGELRRRSLP
jgi:hypothetical protein